MDVVEGNSEADKYQERDCCCTHPADKRPSSQKHLDFLDPASSEEPLKACELLVASCPCPSSALAASLSLPENQRQLETKLRGDSL